MLARPRGRGPKREPVEVGALLQPRLRTAMAGAQRAYVDFLEPGISGEEAARRWTLTVHLIHNFKISVAIRLPSNEWPTWPPGQTLRTIPDAWPEPSTPEQKYILSRVSSTSEFLQGFGFRVPIRSALLSLMQPDDYCIVDRWAFSALVGLTGPFLPIAGMSTLGSNYPDESMVPIPREFSTSDYHAYVDAMKQLADAAEVKLLTAERACFCLGQESGSIKGRSWRQYREQMLLLLTEKPPIDWS